MFCYECLEVPVGLGSAVLAGTVEGFYDMSCLPADFDPLTRQRVVSRTTAMDLNSDNLNMADMIYSIIPYTITELVIDGWIITHRSVEL